MENKKIIPLLIIALVLYRLYKRNKELIAENFELRQEVILNIGANLETEILLCELKKKPIKKDITAYEVFENLNKVANGKPAFDPENAQPYSVNFNVEEIKQNLNKE